MILQPTLYEKEKFDLSSASWTLHEFFAGSGLVAYDLQGMFAPGLGERRQQAESRCI